MCLLWQNVHITGENIFNGNLQKIQSQSWNFSHTDDIIKRKIEKNSRFNYFIFGGVEGCENNKTAGSTYQAPILIIVAIPQEYVPTTLAYNNRHTSNLTVQKFENAHYSWVLPPQ